MSDSEQAVLGTLLLKSELLGDVMGVLKPEHFETVYNQNIYRAMLEEASEGRRFDAVSMMDTLKGKVNGEDLIGLANDCGWSVSNLKVHADNVVQNHLHRKIRAMGKQLTNENLKPREAMDMIQTSMVDMTYNVGSGHPEHVKKSVKEFWQFLDGETELGRPTGWDDLDKEFVGLTPGDLIIVAGRPAMGKSVFAMNLAERVCKDKGTAMVFTLEMSKRQLMMRTMASQSSIPLSRIQERNLTQGDLALLAEQSKHVAGWDMVLDDSGSLTASEIRSRASQQKLKGLDLVVVDYLQLLASDGGQTREQEVSSMSRQLKRLAKELHVPVVALSQLNRSLEQRPNKRPIIPDLRESGGIEQDADVILFLYRNEYYHPGQGEGACEVNIAKQRMGASNKMVVLRFEGPQQRFVDWTGAYMPHQQKRKKGL